ncbi:cold shock domain-containing protein [Pseudomonas sp. NPDC089422]|uniref:cold shock domain-containing protein n=1 Tax=Pseudomonas sp. NPDC089422 TaxID=3364466 RepID=UPI00382413AA
MSDVKVGIVKMFNDKIRSGFIEHDGEEDDAILTTEEVKQLALKNDVKVEYKTTEKNGKIYATDVKLKK